LYILDQCMNSNFEICNKIMLLRLCVQTAKYSLMLITWNCYTSLGEQIYWSIFYVNSFSFVLYFVDKILCFSWLIAWTVFTIICCVIISSIMFTRCCLQLQTGWFSYCQWQTE